MSSSVVDTHVLSELFDFPDNVGKLFSARHHDTEGGRKIPVDILERPKEYVFFLDVPGIPKSDIQVTVEDKRTLVIKTNGKRKREETEEEEGCKYIRLERRADNKLMRKFRLPEDANTAAVTAKCENGVLVVAVGKVPPQTKTKKVEVTIG